MAIEFWDGFETGGADRWNSTTGTPTFTSSTKHNGNYAVSCDLGDYLTYSGLTCYCVSVYIYISTSPDADVHIIGTTTYGVGLDSSRKLTFWSSSSKQDTGDTVLSTGTWYRVSLVSNGVGSSKVFLDGNEECTGSPGNSIDRQIGVIDAGSATTGTVIFDDVCFFDHTQLSDVGDMQVGLAVATGEGTDQDTYSNNGNDINAWTGGGLDQSTDAVYTNWDNAAVVQADTGSTSIDQNGCDGDNSNNWYYTVTVDETDSGNLAGVLESNDIIESVLACINFDTEGGGTGDYDMRVRDSDGLVNVNLDDPKVATWQITEYATTPYSSNSWTTAYFDSLEIGAGVTTSGGKGLCVASPRFQVLIQKAAVTTLSVDVSDSITVAESVTPQLDIQQVSVSDSISITESVTPVITTLYVNVSDSITIAESVDRAEAVGALSVDVSDSITITEKVYPGHIDYAAYANFARHEDWTDQGSSTRTKIVYAEGYFYILYRVTPAVVRKVDARDFSSYSDLTFPDDGNHGTANNIVYDSTRSLLYVLFDRSGYVEIDKITLSNFTRSNVLSDSSYDAGAWPGMCLSADNAYCYVATSEGTPTVVSYAISTWTEDDSAALTYVCRYMRHDGTNLHISSSSGYFTKVSPADLSVQTDSANFLPHASEQFGFDDDYIFFLADSAQTSIRVIKKSDMSIQQSIPHPISTAIYAFQESDQDGWIYAAGDIAADSYRFNPVTHAFEVLPDMPITYNGVSLEFVDDYIYLVSHGTGSNSELTEYIPKHQVRDFVNIAESVTLDLPLNVSVSDSISIAESVTPLIPVLYIDVSDSITIAESVEFDGLGVTIEVSDSITIAESVTASIPILYTNVSDTISIAEQVTSTGQLYVDVSDSITIAEDVTATSVLTVDVSDSITIAESVETTGQLYVDISDSITIAEQIDTNLLLNVDVSDSITIVEQVTSTGQLYVDVSDTISVAESVDLGRELFVDVSDVISIAELIQTTGQLYADITDLVSIAEIAVFTGQLYVDVSDSITIADTADADVVEAADLSINVSDTISIAEQVTTTGQLYVDVSDSITVVSDATASIVDAGTLSASVSDTISITEVVATTGQLYVDVSDSITIAEAVETNLLLNVDVSDSITIAEAVQTTGQLYVDVSDSLTIAEAIQSNLALYSSVVDSITITESVTTTGQLYASVSDTVTIAEQVSAAKQLLEVDVSDSISVTDVITNITITEGPTASVWDNITVTDSVTVLIPVLYASVSDSVSVTETIETGLPLDVDVSDTIAVAESIDVTNVLNVNVSDTVTIAETTNQNIPISVSVVDGITIVDLVETRGQLERQVSDSISITEDVTVQIPEAADLNINVSDTITINELITSTGQLRQSVTDTISVNEYINVRVRGEGIGTLIGRGLLHNGLVNGRLTA